MKAAYPTGWGDLRTEQDLVDVASALSLSLHWDRLASKALEERQWDVIVPRGSWPAPEPRGLCAATTDSVRAYLVGMYEMKRWHQARLREIREAVEALT